MYRIDKILKTNNLVNSKVYCTDIVFYEESKSSEYPFIYFTVWIRDLDTDKEYVIGHKELLGLAKSGMVAFTSEVEGRIICTIASAQACYLRQYIHYIENVRLDTHAIKLDSIHVYRDAEKYGKYLNCSISAMLADRGKISCYGSNGSSDGSVDELRRLVYATSNLIDYYFTVPSQFILIGEYLYCSACWSYADDNDMFAKFKLDHKFLLELL